MPRRKWEKLYMRAEKCPPMALEYTALHIENLLLSIRRLEANKECIHYFTGWITLRNT